MTSKGQKTLELTQGSKKWDELRRLCTVSVPGKYSSLYYLNAKILGHEEVVPMTYEMHMAPCLFAEGATGIPEIDGCRIKMLLWPRGSGKSTCITKGMGIHRHLQRKDYALGIANEVTANAEAFLAMIKQEFEGNQLLRTLFPEKCWREIKDSPTWTSRRIVLPREKPNPVSPSVLATGVDATVTGVHMNEWLLDDILSQNAAEAAYKGNFSEIEATNRWIQRLQPLLKSPKRDPITIVGTRWWQGDTYEFLEDYFGGDAPREEYLWTLTLPNGVVQNITVYRRGEIAVFRRAARVDGKSIFPERYDDDELDKMQREDPVFFAGQYLLEPTAGGAAEFDPKWLKYYEWEGHQIRYRREDGRMAYVDPKEMVCFISADPAISDSVSAARSAVPVIGVSGDGQFLLDDYAERGLGMYDLAHRIVEAYVRWRPRKVFIETVVYQRALIEALRKVADERGVRDLVGAVEEIRSHKGASKDFRIYGLEPFFKRGTFYVHRSQTRFIEEYTSFPLGNLRDTLDAISFQTEAWNRFAMTQTRDSGGRRVDAVAEGHKRAIDRIKAAMRLEGFKS